MKNTLAAVLCGVLIGLPFIIEAVRSFLTQ